MAIRWLMAAEGLSASGTDPGGSTTVVFDGGGQVQIGSTAGRNGRPGFVNMAQVCRKLCTTGGVAWNQSTLRLLTAIRLPSGGGGICDWRDGTDTHVLLTRDASGRGVFQRSGSTVIAQTAIGVIPATPSYPHIEALCTVSPTTGVVALRVNGVQVELFAADGTTSLGTTATGLNTRGASGSNIITNVGWHGGSASCDWMVSDTTGAVNNSWIGDKQTRFDVVSGAGTYQGGTIAGSSPAATRFQSVNQSAADDDVTYVSLATGDALTFVWPGINASARGIVALAPFARLRKDDAGVNTVKHRLRTSAGADRDGFDITLTSAYAEFVGPIEEVNPVTGLAWQPLDAPEVGVVRTV